MKFISMSKIPQFKNVVKEIVDSTRFVGLDKDGNPIYYDTDLPCITFKGTTKIHGTNSSVAYDGNEIWAQSKTRIITPDKDNAGFAKFVEENKEYFRNMLSSLYIGVPIAVFGEWAGDGLSSPAAIAKVPRSFFIFGVKAYDVGWIDVDIVLKEHPQVYKIEEFGQYFVDIDFNNPGLAQNKIVEMVEEVEKECPVAKKFGIYGVGEGIVFTAFYNKKWYQFKVKGEKHVNKTKIKKLQKVDEQKLQLIQDVAEKVTSAWRLDQMWNETFINEKPSIEKLGEYLKALFRDIMIEEQFLLDKNGLVVKDINKFVAKIAKAYFIDRLEEIYYANF